MKVLDFKRPTRESPPEVKLPAHELECYQSILWTMARYLEQSGISCDSLNKLYGMLSLSMAKLTVSAEHAGIDVMVDKVLEGVERDIDKEMEKYLTTDDYKLYFEE